MTALMVTILGDDALNDPHLHYIPQSKVNAITSDVTKSNEAAIQAWFHEKGFKCAIGAAGALGTLFIDCTPEAAAAFEEAANNKQITGLTSKVIIEQEPYAQLPDHNWVKRRSQRGNGSGPSSLP